MRGTLSIWSSSSIFIKSPCISLTLAQERYLLRTSAKIQIHRRKRIGLYYADDCDSMYPNLLSALYSADVQLVNTCSHLISTSCLTTLNGSAIFINILTILSKAYHIIKALRELKPAHTNDWITIEDYLEFYTSFSVMKPDKPSWLQKAKVIKNVLSTAGTGLSNRKTILLTTSEWMKS